MANEFIVKKGLISRGDITVVSGSSISTDKLKARSSSGLFLVDDADNGIFIKDGGNVGIGTTNPGQALTLGNLATLISHTSASVCGMGYGAGTKGYFFDSSVNSNNVFMREYDNIHFKLYDESSTYRSIAAFKSAGASPRFNFRDTLSLGWVNGDPSSVASDIGLSRGASGKLYVGNGTAADYTGTLIAGNVGIGTTDPNNKLHINGGLQIDSDLASSPAGNAVTMEYNTTYNAGHIQAWNGKSLVLNGGGNKVGIGTTNPDGKLHVYSGDAGTFTPNTNADDFVIESNTWAGMTIVTPNSAAGFIYFADPNDNDVGAIYYQHSNNNMLFKTAGAFVLVLDDSQNVGFGGVTSPTEQIDISGGDKNIHVDSTPSANGTYSGGIITTTSVSGNATGFGAALHIDTDGSYIEAKADSTATMPCDALAVEAGTGSKKIMMQGFVKNTSWSWTIGGTIYVSTSTGDLTQTAPSTTGDQVQAVARATATDTLYFNPDYTMIEIA